MGLSNGARWEGILNLIYNHSRENHGRIKNIEQCLSNRRNSSWKTEVGQNFHPKQNANLILILSCVHIPAVYILHCYLYLMLLLHIKAQSITQHKHFATIMFIPLSLSLVAFHPTVCHSLLYGDWSMYMFKFFQW